MKEYIALPEGQPGSRHKSQAVKANGFMFLSAQRGFDPGLHRITSPYTDEQGRQLFENMKVVLEAAGGSLNDVIKTGIYLKNQLDWPATDTLWAEHFAGQTPPASSILQVTDIFGPDNPTSILVDTIALAPGSPPKEIIRVPDGRGNRELGSYLVKANGFLFFPGQRGVDPATNKVLHPDTAKQMRQILENMKAALESLGGSMNDVVKTGLFFKDMAERPEVNEIWSEYFGHESPPTRFAVQMVDVSRADDPSRILVDAIALMPGSSAPKECFNPPLAPRFGPFVSQVVKANGFLFLAAQRGVDQCTNKVEIPDTASQARQILENMTAVLESFGGSLDDVVKTGLYLKNSDDLSGVNEVWKTFFGDSLPNWFSVQVADIFGGPDLTNLLVDAIAIVPGS
jgi:2-iminobutanoate/2-iminopropanoate deaminase